MSTQTAAGVPPREINGPSAFGGGFRRFFALTWIIAATDFKLTYFGSMLGYLWSLMRPLLLFGVLYVVFSQILDFGGDIESYPMILLLNIVLFTFFSEATQMSLTAVVNRESLVRKMHFPRLVIPLSTVLTAAFNLGVNLVAVLGFMLVYGIQPRASWLLFPLVLVVLIAFTAGVSMILSALYVRFRDVAPIWAVLSTVLFYGSPVLYTIEFVPEEYRTAFVANPLAALFEIGRLVVIDPSAPTLSEATGNSAAWLPPLLIVLALPAIGLWFFSREAPRVAEEL